MSVVLVPVPPTPDYLEGTSQHWLPLLSGIEKRSRIPVAQLADEIMRGLVHIVLAWDDEQNRALALAGVTFWPRGEETVARILWTTGEDMQRWVHLWDDLETYLKEHCHCSEIEPVCRPGWAPFLKSKGYRRTHVVMTKAL